MRFRDDVAQKQFGMTQKSAWELGVCIRCKQPPLKIKTPEEKREYYISALCPQCWEAIAHEH